MVRTTTRLRSLPAQAGMAVASGMCDGITGRFAEQAGFTRLYMTGVGTSLSPATPTLGCSP